MNNYKRFTKEEDDVIVACIKANNILDKAFDELATQLGRTKASITNHYYSSKVFESYRKDRSKLEKSRKDRIKRAFVKEIKKSPNNIQNAIRRTACKTGISPNSLSSGYYSKNSSYLNRSNIGICFTLISGKKVIHNGKNTEQHQPNVKASKTLKLFEFFKRLFS